MKIIYVKYIPHKFVSIFVFLFLFVLLSSSCSKEQKIKENTFVKIYADLVIAQDSLGADSLGFVNEQKKIFTKYKVNKDLYIKTLEYYKKNPEEWKSLFKKVITYLREEEKKRP